jgi:hypothetical protein
MEMQAYFFVSDKIPAGRDRPGVIAAPLPEIAGVGSLTRIAKVAATLFILMSREPDAISNAIRFA